MKPFKLIPPLSAEHIRRFWAKVAIGEPDACWPVKRPTNHAYGDFTVGRVIHLPAHRVAYYLHYGVDPGSQLVCHSCDNPACCNPAHLFLGDYKINKQDCIAKNRHRHKLTTSDVFTIRRLLAEGSTFRALAKQFGVGHGSIQAIAEGTVWKGVPFPKERINAFGKDRSGERNGRSTLTANQIPEIRRLIASGLSCARIGKIFGVSGPTIADIRYGRHWQHVA